MSHPSPETVASPTPARSRGPGTIPLIIVIAIIGGGILLTTLTSDVTRVSEPGVRLVDDKPFLPPVAGEWQGGELGGLTKEERDVLPADTEGARRAYTAPDGRQIYCSVVLAGRDVTSIHRPELCLTGQGWKLAQLQTEKIEIPGAPGGALTVSRLNATSTIELKQGHAYAVFVYWFVGKDRTTPHHWERIYWTTLDRVLHNRNHRWAYFLISAIVPPDQVGADPAASQDAAMAAIGRFVREAYPLLTAQ
jgi:EpsI family protein